MLTLRCHYAGAIPIEAECLTPDRLTELSARAIAALPVQHGNASVALGEFFAVEGDAADREILIEGDGGCVKHLGAGMISGRLTIRGNVGMHLGAHMRGGEIHVHGNAGDWTGAEMRGGRIHIHGHAGNLAGAGYRGSRLGMRGGVLLIDGNAGHEVGATLRRGLIAVGGDAGDYVGAAMIAGSIFVGGRVGDGAGSGMKRGTLALLGPMASLSPTFRRACVYRPPFVTIYLRQLQAWGFPVSAEVFRGEFQRYSGDLLALGKGEVLHWQP